MAFRRDIDEEDIIDVNSLKSFTIPKKKKSKRELFEVISLQCREFQHELKPIFDKSLTEKDGSNNFKFIQARLVHNDELFNAYLDRRKEMRQNGYSEKEVQDNYAFFYSENELMTKRICEEGIKVGNTNVSVLGNSKMGVCLSKHADLPRSYPLFMNSINKIIIFRFMKGKIKTMIENRGGEPLDPTPNYDCHVSKQAGNIDNSWAHQLAYESSQYYLYEYGDFDLVDRPRQICPFAVLEFRFTGDQKVAPRPLLMKQISSPKVSAVSSRASMPPAASSRASMPPMMSRGHHRLIHSSALKHSGLELRNDPRRGRAPSRSSSQDENEARQKLKSRGPDDSDPRHDSRDSRSSSVDSNDPWYKSVSRTSSVEGNDSSDTSDLISVPHKVADVGSVGSEVDGNGVIVWSGALATRGLDVCPVNVIMFGEAVKPARFGRQLTLGKRLPFLTAKNRYFTGLSNLQRNKETKYEGRYYTYGEIRATKQDQTKLNQMVTYLTRKSSVVLTQLDDHVDLIILINCEITQSLGLSLPGIHAGVLYCVFVSPTSRSSMLLARCRTSPRMSSSSSGAPSPRPPPSPVDNRLVHSPGLLVRFTPPLNTPTPSPGTVGYTAPVLNRESLSQAFCGQSEQALHVMQHEFGPASVSSQPSTDSWSLPPSPSVFSNPSPASVVHNVDDLHPSAPFFREPHTLSRASQGDDVEDYDGGYQTFVPVDSLIYKNNLLKNFNEQSLLQDRRNIDMARKRTIMGMGPPQVRPPSRSTEPGSPLGPPPRKRTLSQDSGSSNTMSPMVMSGTPLRTPGSDSYPSSISSYGDVINGPALKTLSRVPHIIGPHGQLIEPISPAESTSSVVTPPSPIGTYISTSSVVTTPSPISTYSTHESYDPLEQLQQQLHQKMSPIKVEQLQQQLHQKMSPIKGEPLHHGVSPIKVEQLQQHLQQKISPIKVEQLQHQLNQQMSPLKPPPQYTQSSAGGLAQFHHLPLNKVPLPGYQDLSAVAGQSSQLSQGSPGMMPSSPGIAAGHAGLVQGKTTTPANIPGSHSVHHRQSQNLQPSAQQLSHILSPLHPQSTHHDQRPLLQSSQLPGLTSQKLQADYIQGDLQTKGHMASTTSQFPGQGSTSHKVLNDPRLTRRQDTLHRGHMTGGRVSQAEAPPSILQNILTTSARDAKGAGPAGLTTGVGNLPVAMEKLVASAPHPSHSQMGLPSRDPRLSSLPGAPPTTSPLLPLDGSQNLAMSLSVGTTSLTQCTVAASGSQVTGILPPCSISDSTSMELMHSLVQKLTGHTSGRCGLNTMVTPSSATRPISSTMTSSSSNTARQEAGTTKPCLTERLLSESGSSLSVTRQGLTLHPTIPHESTGSSQGSPYDPAGSIPGTPDDLTGSTLVTSHDPAGGSPGIPYDPERSLPLRLADEKPYDPSDDITNKTVRRSSSEYSDDDFSPVQPSLSDIAGLKEDFDDIVKNPKLSHSPQLAKSDEADINLSDDLVNLIVRSQPLAAKAARELKEQIRDIEEQSKHVEEQTKEADKRIRHRSHIGNVTASGGELVPNIRPKGPRIIDSSQVMVKNNHCVDSGGSESPDSQVSRGHVDPVRRTPPEKDVCKMKSLRTLDYTERQAKKTRLDPSELTDSCKTVTKLSPSVLEKTKIQDMNRASSKSLEFLNPGTASVKALPRIPKKGSTDVDQDCDTKPTALVCGSPQVASPVDDPVIDQSSAEDIKEIPIDAVSEDAPKVNGHKDNSVEPSVRYSRELEYYGQVYDGATNQELLGLGLDYVSIRFIGGARVHRLLNNRELRIIKELKPKELYVPKEPEKAMSKEQMIKDSVTHILHSSESSQEESAADRDRVLLWHIALHYLLPLIESPYEDSREVVDDSTNQVNRQGGEAGQQDLSSKASSLSSRSDRYHPYRRPSRSKNDEEEKAEIFKIYRSYRDLNDLMQCLTAKNFRSRHTRPLNNIFSGPFSKREASPRFKGYNFKRHSLDDLARIRNEKIRGDDDEDKIYSLAEITDYEKRKQFSKTIDTEYIKAVPTCDIFNSQLEAERQIYGEDENKNQTDKEEGRSINISSSTTASHTVTRLGQSSPR